MSKVVKCPQCSEEVLLKWFEDGGCLTGKCSDCRAIVNEFPEEATDE